MFALFVRGLCNVNTNHFLLGFLKNCRAMVHRYIWKYTRVVKGRFTLCSIFSLDRTPYVKLISSKQKQFVTRLTNKKAIQDFISINRFLYVNYVKKLRSKRVNKQILQENKSRSNLNCWFNLVSQNLFGLSNFFRVGD